MGKGFWRTTCREEKARSTKATFGSGKQLVNHASVHIGKPKFASLVSICQPLMIDPQKMELDWKEIRERQDEPARNAVHARLVLDAIAGEKGLEVDDSEVDDKIRAEAARIGEPVGEVRKRLAESGPARRTSLRKIGDCTKRRAP